MKEAQSQLGDDARLLHYLSVPPRAAQAVVEMLREAELIRRGTETESYMRVAHLRYLILRTHSWDDAVIEAVRRELATPSWEDDTMVRTLRKELR